MKSRRDILNKGAAAATGLTLLSGCSRLENKSSEQNQITIPFEGLGTYENWIEEAQPVGSNYVQEKHLEKITDDELSIDEEATELAKIIKEQHQGFELNTLMKGYHLDKQDPENQVLLNKSTYLHHENDLFEIFKVENGEFQSKPILVGSLGDYHKPGDKVDIDNAILNYLREDKGTSRVPEDLQKTKFDLDNLSTSRDVDEGDIEDQMEMNMNYWSECILGLHESGIPIRPENFEDGVKVYNAKYQNGDTDAYVSLCQAVDNEEILNAENVVEAKYNGETWELNENPEADIGDFYQEGLTNPFN